ncbi:hypothetical protein DERF_005774 [Dermatophagoides farinae]|uniref:Uncharacterized protein n=1 Tax=Dermatophagoides farinae TaxID=6954 RepID=A0A922LBL7_DERFA|nr:hypothetical protein DERF_005774 [Dermatophagoides farinae]
MLFLIQLSHPNHRNCPYLYQNIHEILMLYDVLASNDICSAQSFNIPDDFSWEILLLLALTHH